MPLSVDIKDWLRKNGQQTGKSMQDIAAEILEEVYRREKKLKPTQRDWKKTYPNEGKSLSVPV